VEKPYHVLLLRNAIHVEGKFNIFITADQKRGLINSITIPCQRTADQTIVLFMAVLSPLLL
jgi:hypothetical protein